MSDVGRKLGLVLIILSAFTITVSAADWNFEQSEGNLQDLSNDSISIFTAKLVTDDGDELTPERLPFYQDDFDDSNYVNASYVDSEGNESSRALLYHEGLDVWYTQFEVTPQEVNFTAQGTSSGEFQDSNGIETSEFNVNIGDYDLDIVTGFEEPVRPGSNERTELNVSLDGDFDEEADVSVYFHNHTNETSIQNLGDQDTGEEIHYGDVNVPDNPDSHYVMRVEAENQETGDVGSYSRFVEVLPRLDFDINEFTSLDCDTSGIASRCEPETNIATEVEITDDEADSVNVSTWLHNRTSDELEQVENNSLALEGGVYVGNVEMPDINKSAFEPYAVFRVNASNEFYSVTEDVQIDLETFNLGFEGEDDAFINSDYELAFEAEKAYSGDNYNLTRFDEINGTVSRSGSFDLQFTEEDFSYDESSGLIVSEFTIPEDASTGIHDVEFNFTDIYNETKPVTGSFRVNEFDQNFEVVEGLTADVNKLHEVNRTLEVQNNGGATLDIDVNLSEEFDGLVNMTDNFGLEPEENKKVNYTVNLTEPNDVEGTINLTESTGYSVERTFEIFTPDCQVRNGSICADSGEVDFGTVETNSTEQLEIFNLHEPEMNLNISAGGNISEYMDFDNSKSFNDSITYPLVFEPNTAGNFTGTLTLESESNVAEVNLSAESNATEPGDTGLSLTPSNADVTAPEGESGVAGFDLENTGDVEVTNIVVELEEGETDIEEFDLSSGDSTMIEVEVSESDAVTVTGESSSGDVSSEASITFEEMDDYSNRADELEDRVADLRVENEDPSLDDQLTDVTVQAERIRDQWDNGDYDQAQQTFNEAEASLDELDTEIQSQQTDTGGGGQQTPDPGQNGESQEDEGLPIIPIIAILAILMLIGGFIFFESYIPEEGDPLYGVLN